MTRSLGVLTILFFMLIGICNAQSTAHTRLESMGRKGINLANWLEAGWLGSAYPNPREYTREDLEALARMGFRTIRVPVIFEWITSDEPPYGEVVDKTPFDLIDSVVVPVAEKYNLVVILDNHHGYELTEATYLSDIPRLCGMWTALAKKYKHLPPERYFFELRNEPTYEIENGHLHQVQQQIIDSIRVVDQDRTLIVGANWWNAGGSLAESEPYDDPSENIIYTFHNYDPFPFTHQGFSWSGLPTGPTFSAADPEAEPIREVVRRVKQWSNQHGVPVFLGEFGVSWFADAASRCAYITFMTTLMANTEIPWLYWDVKHGYDAFGIFTGTEVRADELIPCFKDAMGLTVTGAADAPVAHRLVLGISPQPVNGKARVSCTLPAAATLHLTVHDLSGREVARLAAGEYAAGTLEFRWQAGALPPGSYFLRLDAGGLRAERRVLVTR
ncbi:MAG: cellulase family glycosylhydrolase [Ignavibacteriae bacterium]|nr:cellulase family glycosylhydrolase [Ignavibacteriota bacterium]